MTKRCQTYGNPMTLVLVLVLVLVLKRVTREVEVNVRRCAA